MLSSFIGISIPVYLTQFYHQITGNHPNMNYLINKTTFLIVVVLVIIIIHIHSSSKKKNQTF